MKGFGSGKEKLTHLPSGTSPSTSKQNRVNINHQSLTILHQNSDRISNKIERLNTLLNTLTPDIVIITEHGQKKETLQNTRLIGYSLLAEYSREHHMKGGVAIYIKEVMKLHAEAIYSQDICVEMTCEVAIIKVQLKRTPIFIVGVYRTTGNLEHGLEVISLALDKIPTDKNPVILLGDVNIDSLDKKNDYFQMSELLTSYDMYRAELPATRITPTSKTSIDCVCSNLCQDELDIKVIATGISDHTGQLCTVNMKTKLPVSLPIMTRRLTNNNNLLKLKHMLGELNWEEVYSNMDINDAYNNFIHNITVALNESCPMIRSRGIRRHNKQILNDPTATCLKKRFLEAQAQYNITGTVEHKKNVCQLKKEYDLRLRLLRRQETKTNIAEADNKTRAVWRVINSERRLKEETTLPVELDIQGTCTSNPAEMADHLNNFFVNIANNIILSNNQHPGNTLLQLPDNPNIPPFVLHPTNKQEIIKVIKSLKTKNSAGYDDISAKLLKTCKEELIDPLVDITNKSFASGVFPSALKLAKVYPKFKQGATNQASNYRPISLIPTFSKVIEKVTSTRLINHMITNDLLTPNQHGFTTGRSTITALTSLVEYLIDQLEEGNTTMAILLDYSKAFDCLSHEHLMAKLKTLGIRGTAHNWFNSYLTGRKQIVEIKYTNFRAIHHVNSQPMTITRGVPQGSVLGPLLFILFINDFPSYQIDYSRSLLYADDTALLLGSRNPEHLEVASYTALNMAIQYCHSNDLTVNESKTKQLILGRHKEIIGRFPNLEEITSAKYLGITIDDGLTWTPHINLLCKRLSVSLFVIRRMKNISDTTTAKITYYALFETNLRYGISVWGATSAGNLKRVLLLQKRAIRMLGDLQPRETCRETYKSLKILTVINIYILEVVTYLHLKSPDSTKTAAQTHGYNTRYAANYCLPIHHLSLTEKKPSYMGAKMWNALPQELKKLQDKDFQHKLKNWLIKHPFYSLSEFFQWNICQ